MPPRSRAREFARLDATACAYLDYTGAALYPRRWSSATPEGSRWRVMGNPHSESGAVAGEHRGDRRGARADAAAARRRSRRYEVVFTANASGAIRILAEAFPFRTGSRLVLTADNHNSVNGIRVRARRRGAAVAYMPLDAELRAIDPRPHLTTAAAPSLFAFPAQSNFSGVRHPLDWVEAAQARGYRVLLDAAAYLPTSRLSLAETPADFVALSFYKIFGYPTGVGALVVRREALALLRRSYFGGGTVQFVSVQNRRARLHDGAPAFEDGTPSFLAMPAVGDGLRWFARLGVERIGEHVQRCTASLLDRLQELGDRVVVYGPHDLAARGGTVAFNLRQGTRVVEYEVVETAARERGIAIRGGCFCNPGAAEHAFRIDPARAWSCLKGPFVVGRFRNCLGDGAVGALRASVGLATSEEDLDRLVALLIEFRAYESCA